MKKGTAAALVIAGAALILDSRYAAISARDALVLCAHTLVPSLFPLFVVSGMLVPGLQGFRLSWLARLLGMPQGAEGIWLLGLVGGFPMGAAAIRQTVESGSLSKSNGARMMGLCSLCGPSFLFGVLPQLLPIRRVFALFVLQAETSLLLSAFWPGKACGCLSPTANNVSFPEAVRRAVDSMLSVCAWVVLAGIAAGFLRRWLFPLLPTDLGLVLTGLLELTNGIFSLPEENRFLFCALFVCFGGVSVLLQIGGLASPAGIQMASCILQKAFHGILGTLFAWLYLRLGPGVLVLIPAILFVKITVEIPGHMMYNVRERKGFKCCFGKKWTGPASTAATARR